MLFFAEALVAPKVYPGRHIPEIPIFLFFGFYPRRVEIPVFPINYNFRNNCFHGQGLAPPTGLLKFPLIHRKLGRPGRITNRQKMDSQAQKVFFDEPELGR